MQGRCSGRWLHAWAPTGRSLESPPNPGKRRRFLKTSEWRIWPPAWFARFGRFSPRALTTWEGGAPKESWLMSRRLSIAASRQRRGPCHSARFDQPGTLAAHAPWRGSGQQDCVQLEANRIHTPRKSAAIPAGTRRIHPVSLHGPHPTQCVLRIETRASRVGRTSPSRTEAVMAAIMLYLSQLSRPGKALVGAG